MKFKILNKKKISEYLISDTKSIIEGIKKLNKTKNKILFIVNSKKKLIGSLSDGDLRFGLQKKLSLNDNIVKFCNKKIKFFTLEQKKKINFSNLNFKDIRHIPIVNKNKIIKEIIFLFSGREESGIIDTPFVIIAGGVGKRLMPLTEYTPKPLIKINNKPIIDHIIDKAISEGFNNFIISTGFKGNKIKNYLEDGKKKNIKIRYINENSPLGTAGFLYLLKQFNYKNYFISNGDVLTRFKYKNLLDFHLKKKSDATIAAINKVLRFPFGEVEFDKENFLNIEEKPLIEKFINCGLYVLSQKSLSTLKKKIYLDMPEFFNLIKKNKKKIKVYSLYESWTDVTNLDDVKYLDKINSNFYDL
tara:strand:+ start:667 stop:1743 length:1077 start_codon:yes stop_codon:yes gene_type:complete